jgi:hypothetical protein
MTPPIRYKKGLGQAPYGRGVEMLGYLRKCSDALRSSTELQEQEKLEHVFPEWAISSFTRSTKLSGEEGFRTGHTQDLKNMIRIQTAGCINQKENTVFDAEV